MTLTPRHTSGHPADRRPAPTVAFPGIGNRAEAVMAGVLRAGHDRHTVHVTAGCQERVEHFTAHYGVAVITSHCPVTASVEAR